MATFTKRYRDAAREIGAPEAKPLDEAFTELVRAIEERAKERVFPMPTRYPTYAWYSPASPNGIDMGDDCGRIGGAWDTPYFHCVQLLERLGCQEALQRAVFRRAEVIHREQDCLESYRLDGTVDHARFFNRDQYILTSAAGSSLRPGTENQSGPASKRDRTAILFMLTTAWTAER
jgi:hypothetical protein